MVDYDRAEIIFDSIYPTRTAADNRLQEVAHSLLTFLEDEGFETDTVCGCGECLACLITDLKDAEMLCAVLRYDDPDDPVNKGEPGWIGQEAN